MINIAKADLFKENEREKGKQKNDVGKTKTFKMGFIFIYLFTDFFKLK
jgi:hypothetical protein